jgi:hypothetical protein
MLQSIFDWSNTNAKGLGFLPWARGEVKVIIEHCPTGKKEMN